MALAVTHLSAATDVHPDPGKTYFCFSIEQHKLHTNDALLLACPDKLQDMLVKVYHLCVICSDLCRWIQKEKCVLHLGAADDGVHAVVHPDAGEGVLDHVAP